MATEILMTQNASLMRDPVVVRIYDPTPRYRRGGLHRRAEAVRRGGEMGDEILLHINRDEFEQLKRSWGEPTINDNTGLPEYGLKRLFKKAGNFVKRALKNPLVQTLAPIAANIFLPGIGGLIAQSALGAVTSKANGGNPLTGALMGGAGHFIGGGGIGKGSTSLVPGEGGPLSRIFGGGNNPLQGADALTAAGLPTGAGFSAAPLTGGMGATGGGGALSRIKDFFTNSSGKPAWGKIAGAGAGALGLLGSMGGGSDDQQSGGPSVPDGWNDPAEQLTFNRQQIAPPDLSNYGRTGGEHRFFSDPTYDPQTPGLADGGGVHGPGTGRSDSIEALLSDGEYVMDAETVALLGDGSLDAGASRLDELRRNVRKHKGSALAKGKFSPDARTPDEYMGKAKGGKVHPKFSPAELNAEMRRMAESYSRERPKPLTHEEATAELNRLAQRYMQNPEAKAKGGNVQLGVKDLPPVNSNLPSPLPNADGRYAGAQNALEILSQQVQEASDPALVAEARKLFGVGMTEKEFEAFKNSKMRGRAKGGRIRGDWVERIIPGDVGKKRSLEERAQDLESLERMIEAYKESQAHLPPEERPGYDPRNKPKLRLVKARGGAVDVAGARQRLAAIQAMAQSTPVGLAEGGPVQELTNFADHLETTLAPNNTDRIQQLNTQMNGLTPATLRTRVQTLAKGGRIRPPLNLAFLKAIKNVENKPPKRIPEEFTSEEIDSLLKPGKDPALSPPPVLPPPVEQRGLVDRRTPETLSLEEINRMIDRFGDEDTLGRGR